MSKKSIIQRDLKKKKIFKENNLKIENLKNKIIKNSEKLILKLRLHLFSRNSSKTRLKNRCLITGRSRGIFRKFLVSRFVLRNKALKGEIPGFLKSSW